jgi:geranylgeranyl reductase family protein
MDYVGEHEVIVVGAGPSGAATSTALSQKGHDVLLIDRHSFPRDKICGDAVGVGVTKLLYQLGLAEKIQEAIREGKFYPLKTMRLVSPSGQTLQAAFTNGEHGEESLIAPRLYFDAVLQQHAVENGVRFLRAEVMEPIVEEGRVVGVRARENGAIKSYRSQVVVGADGVTSTIMRHLRPESDQHRDMHRAVALRAYIDDLEIYPHEVEFYLYREISPGYAWIFPASDHSANIGLGMRLDIYRRKGENLKKMLRDFLDIPDIRKRLQRGGVLRNIATWPLSFGSQGNLQYAYDGALLVGDAAGFINPLTGGGIHNGVLSALFAAETIDEALRRRDTSRESLRIYEKRCEEEMRSGMRRSFFYQRLLIYFPGFADLLVKTLKHRTDLSKIFLQKL